MYADKQLTCRDCGNDFVFSAGEQEFYTQKGFTNEPTRCPSCKAQRKAAAGGRSGSTYRDSYGDRDPASAPRQSRGPQEMYRETGTSCGRDALVPFEPRGDKLVYCSDCFQAHRPSSSRS